MCANPKAESWFESGFAAKNAIKWYLSNTKNLLFELEVDGEMASLVMMTEKNVLNIIRQVLKQPSARKFVFSSERSNGRRRRRIVKLKLHVRCIGLLMVCLLLIRFM